MGKKLKKEVNKKQNKALSWVTPLTVYITNREFPRKHLISFLYSAFQGEFVVVKDLHCNIRFLPLPKEK